MRLRSIVQVGFLCALAHGSVGAATWQVAVENNSFEPAELHIHVGDSVQWTNDSGGTHNVFAADGSFRCANGCDDTGGDGSPASNGWTFTRAFPEQDSVFSSRPCTRRESPPAVAAATSAPTIP